MPKSSLEIFRLDLLKNKTYKPLLIMDGYILKLSGGAIAYSKVSRYPKIYCAHASTNQGTWRLKQPQGCGDTPGVPSNFDLSLMTLELNMLGRNMPTTCAKSSNSIIKSQKIVRDTNLQALTWNIIIPPITMNAHAASQSRDILK